MITSLNSMALKIHYSIQENSLEFLLLDQTLLPQTEKWLTINSLDQMIEAIQRG